MWHEALEDLWWAERFHLMPQMVDELPYSRANRLRVATEAIDEGRAKRADEETKRQS